MSTTISALCAEWGVVATSQESRDAVTALCAVSPATRAYGVSDLDALLAAMRAGRRQGEGTPERAAAVVADTLENLDAHALLPRFLIQALLPAVLRDARRNRWGERSEWSDREEFLADCLSEMAIVCAEWAGERRPYALLDLPNAVRCRLRRRIVSFTPTWGEVPERGHRDDTSEIDGTVSLLGQLPSAQAQLVFDLAIAGRQQQDAADARGVGKATVIRRHAEAITKLRRLCAA